MSIPHDKIKLVLQNDGNFRLEAIETFKIDGATIPKGYVGGIIGPDVYISTDGSSWVSHNSVVTGKVDLWNTIVSDSTITAPTPVKFENCYIAISEINITSGDNLIADSKFIEASFIVKGDSKVTGSTVNVRNSVFEESTVEVSECVNVKFVNFTHCKVFVDTLFSDSDNFGKCYFSHSTINGQYISIGHGVQVYQTELTTKNCWLYISDCVYFNYTYITMDYSDIDRDEVVEYVIPKNAMLAGSCVDIGEFPIIYMEFQDFYPVTITDNHIKIGCQQKSIRDWASVGAEEGFDLDLDLGAEFAELYLPSIVKIAENRKPVLITENGETRVRMYNED